MVVVVDVDEDAEARDAGVVADVAETGRDDEAGWGNGNGTEEGKGQTGCWGLGG